eukprot:TRINITY_DN20547_c0_g1_i3.p2 TRINITY_DN20547_c0_g1~~TRINITY_DN20547_c0_g1_i3.p2  ORF type:complete len:453 (-),score=72.99 TRINITY_DN20547_c0_g1_i3:60-1418(-)
MADAGGGPFAAAAAGAVAMTPTTTTAVGTPTASEPAAVSSSASTPKQGQAQTQQQPMWRDVAEQAMPRKPSLRRLGNAAGRTAERSERRQGIAGGAAGEPGAAQSQGSSVANGAAGTGATEDAGEFDWVHWTPDEVGEWVDILCGEGAGEPFRHNKIDGPTLPELSDDDLKNLLGVSNPLNRSKILGHARVLHLRRSGVAMQPTTPVRGRATSPSAGAASHMPCGAASAGAVASGAGLAADGAPLGHPAPARRKAAGGGYPGGAASASLIGSLSSGSLASYLPARSSFSPTETLSSVDSRRADDERSGFSTTNRFSRYTNPNKASTVGLTSYFGLDSPSYSLGGSFSRAPRRQETATSGPGPCSYNAQHPRTGASSPRPTIGNSPRNTTEHFISNHGVAGGGGNRYSWKSPERVKGGVIGGAPRWQDLSPRRRASPGPATYRPKEAVLSTFK